MKSRYLLLMWICLPRLLFAQGSFGDVNEKLFYYQTKLTTQFINRFNFTEQIKTLDGSNISREYNLKSLLNLEDTGLTYNKVTYEFIKATIDDTEASYLEYTSADWYALVDCDFKYKNEAITLCLLLNIQTDSNGSRWKIAGIKDNPALYKQKVCNDKYINPSNNDVRFSELARFLRGNYDAACYSRKTKPDMFSIFLFLLQNDLLSFQQIKNVRYDFFTKNGWMFSVKYYDRNSTNAGWLISKVVKTDQQFLDNYFISNNINQK